MLVKDFRKLRKDMGLSQAEVGKLIGVSDRVVGYYETNVRYPNKPETLREISKVFNVSIDYLLGIEGVVAVVVVGQPPAI